jgi:imidazolonepropionase-like amidohydrolase
LVKQGADIIKIMTTGGGTVGTDPYRAYFTPEELRTVVEEGQRAGKVTAAHCTGFDGLVNSIDAGFDLLVHARFVRSDGTYRFDQATAERIVAAGSFVNPTMHVARSSIWALRQRPRPLTEQEAAALARAETSYDVRVDAVSKMHKMGVKIVAGSDAGWGHYRFGDFYLELEALTDAGLTPMEAIVTGTSQVAACLRVDDRVGTIAAGKAADLLVVSGDPLQDLHVLSRVEAVFLSGQLQAGAALSATPAATSV